MPRPTSPRRMGSCVCRRTMCSTSACAMPRSGTVTRLPGACRWTMCSIISTGATPAPPAETAIFSRARRDWHVSPQATRSDGLGRTRRRADQRLGSLADGQTTVVVLADRTAVGADLQLDFRGCEAVFRRIAAIGLCRADRLWLAPLAAEPG